MGTRKTLPAALIAEAINRLAAAIADRHRETPKLVFLGIANGGIPFCRRLAHAVGTALGRAIPEGTLNVSFHRDDIGRRPIPKSATETALPADVEGASVVLVDDVLFSGRTARAALEEVFSFGRPERIELAVLIDRGNRRLPIAADFVGIAEPTSPDERVRVALDEADPQRDSVTITGPA